MSNKNQKIWRGLSIDLNHNINLSSEEINDMWIRGIRDDDVERLKSFVLKNFLPEEKGLKPLSRIAFSHQSIKVFSWFISSSDFHKEINDISFFYEVISVFNTHIAQSKNMDDFENRMINFVELLKVASPYIFGDNPLRDNDNNTLLHHFWMEDYEHLLLYSESFLGLLFEKEMNSALEIVNKNGDNFFNLIKKDLKEEKSYNLSAEDEEMLEMITDLEIKINQNRLKSLPETQYKKNSNRI